MKTDYKLFIKNVISKPNQGTYDNHQKEDSDKLVTFADG